MKTLEKYVFSSFLTSFLLAFLVLSFVLTIGLMVQIVGYILDGVPISLVGEFAMVCIPETLQWTMPLALLVSSVLVFSRMSADSEVAAMRSCGINLVSIMKWPVVFALGCSLLGIYVNNEIVPHGHEVRRTLKNKVTVGTGLEVLEPGRWITDFPKLKIYFGSKEGNWVKDLIVKDFSDDKICRMITASKALITSEGRDIVLDLYNVTTDPIDAEHLMMGRALRYRHVVKDAIKGTHYRKRDKDFRTFEVFAQLKELDKREAKIAKAKFNDEATREKLAEDVRCERSNLKVEFAKRIVFALASICFVLVGIPLGIKAQRRESTIGMAISLIIALGYYLVVMLMLSLDDYYAIQPQWLIFLPVAACLALAAKLVPRHM